MPTRHELEAAMRRAPLPTQEQSDLCDAAALIRYRNLDGAPDFPSEAFRAGWFASLVAASLRDAPGEAQGEAAERAQTIAVDVVLRAEDALGTLLAYFDEYDPRDVTPEWLAEKAATIRRALNVALAAAQPAPEAPVERLNDEACDKIAARTMDRVAAEKGIEHAMYLNADVTTNWTLRRELIRAGFATAPVAQAAPIGPESLTVEALRDALTVNALNVDQRSKLFGMLAATQGTEGAIPAGVDEALQRLIENAGSLGPASREDALLVAAHRQRLLATPTAQSNGGA